MSEAKEDSVAAAANAAGAAALGVPVSGRPKMGSTVFGNHNHLNKLASLFGPKAVVGGRPVVKGTVSSALHEPWPIVLSMDSSVCIAWYACRCVSSPAQREQTRASHGFTTESSAQEATARKEQAGVHQPRRSERE